MKKGFFLTALSTAFCVSLILTSCGNTSKDNSNQNSKSDSVVSAVESDTSISTTSGDKTSAEASFIDVQAGKTGLPKDALVGKYWIWTSTNKEGEPFYSALSSDYYISYTPAFYEEDLKETIDAGASKMKYTYDQSKSCIAVETPSIDTTYVHYYYIDPDTCILVNYNTGKVIGYPVEASSIPATVLEKIESAKPLQDSIDTLTGAKDVDFNNSYYIGTGELDGVYFMFQKSSSGYSFLFTEETADHSVNSSAIYFSAPVDEMMIMIGNKFYTLNVTEDGKNLVEKEKSAFTLKKIDQSMVPPVVLANFQIH